MDLIAAGSTTTNFVKSVELPAVAQPDWLVVSRGTGVVGPVKVDISQNTLCFLIQE